MKTNQHTQAIRTVDNRLAAIAGERETLKAKSEEAKEISTAVAEARDEVKAAKEELDGAKSDAFILGTDVDFSPFTARLAKAEKRLADVSKNAAGASAAIPRIKGKLVDLDDEESSLQLERARHVAAYWNDLRLVHEAHYMAIVKDLTSSVVTLMAIDHHTTGTGFHPKVGQGLYLGIRNQGLQIPARGNFAIAMPLDPFHDGHVANALARLEAAFDSSLKAKDESLA